MMRRLKALRSLKNKVVLITGGSGGIGRAIALEAARRGAIVIVCARQVAVLRQLATRCMILSGRPAFSFPLDLTDPDAIDDVLTKVRHEVGEIDVLINAAGTGELVEVTKQSQATMAKMTNVNLLAAMYLNRSVAKQMMDQGFGAIINIGALSGKIPVPSSAVYSATKAALIHFSNILRMEVADFGVQVLTVNPGPVQTNFLAQADPDQHFAAHFPAWMFISPEKLAKQIWDSVGYKRREINVPAYTAQLSWLYQVFPGLGDWTIKKVFDYQQNRQQL